MIDAMTIEELQWLLAKATPGPWSTHLVNDTTIMSPAREVATTCDSSQTDREDGYDIEYEQMEADAVLIAAMRNALPDLLDAAERASRAREDALREAIEICKEADAQDDRDNGAAATGAACNAANAILALINKPKGTDPAAPVDGGKDA